MVAELLLADSARCVDLVAEDEERHFGKLLDPEQCIEFGLRLGEALKVGGVDEEDDAGDLGEIIAPETSSLCVTSQIKGCELDVSDGEFFRGYWRG